MVANKGHVRYFIQSVHGLQAGLGFRKFCHGLHPQRFWCQSADCVKFVLKNDFKAFLRRKTEKNCVKRKIETIEILL